jgi:hypothetical protein
MTVLIISTLLDIMKKERKKEEKKERKEDGVFI